MKKLFIFIFFLALIFFGCKKNEAEENQKELDIIYLRIFGQGYLEEDRLEEAEEAFISLIDKDPNDPSGYANLGLVYLKQNKYPEAWKRIRKAVRKAPDNPHIRMILAKYYELTNNREKSIQELETIIQHTPNYIKAIYTLAEMNDQATDQRENYLKQLIEKAAGNIVPRLELIELYLQKGNFGDALLQLEALPQQFAEFPSEAAEFYDKTIQALHDSDSTEAITTAAITHNFLKVSTQYQSDLRDLKGPSGSLIGLAAVSISDLNMFQMKEPESILDRIRFLDVSNTMGLEITDLSESRKDEQTNTSSLIALGDFDNDGDEDIYFSSSDDQGEKTVHKIFRNQNGVWFEPASGEVGINHSGKDHAGIFGDYDNDGYLDLYIIKDHSNILYRNTGHGTFVNMAAEAGVGDVDPGSKALFLDMDQEGDLDLFILKNGSNFLYRNNSNGSFTEQASIMGLEKYPSESLDAAFGDYDEDGDIDVFIVNGDTSNILFSNLRHGRFQDITAESGLSDSGKSTAVVSGDFNNDGFLDLFVLGKDQGNFNLYNNLGDGTFEKYSGEEDWIQSLSQLSGLDAKFLDFDNDGFLDLFIIGEPSIQNTKGAFLFHNDGAGHYTESSNLLPRNLTSGRQVETLDFDKDGDVDILVVDLQGNLRMFLNEGGNLNHFLKIKLVGLREGNNKNNHYGIGAKIEIRAGDLYQMKVVEQPFIHFGLGHRLKSDVVRIIWPNGVPQNLYYPGSDMDLIESQVLKGSCAFLYTWNGNEYAFVKDMMWRSALGMPLGIMGSNTAYAPADVSKEYLKIPGDMLRERDNKYTIQITEELWEAAYFDQLKLVVLDHADSVQVFVDERFTAPPYPGCETYQVIRPHSPVTATDEKGNNLLPYIVNKDDSYISNFSLEKYQGITEFRDLILDPGKNVNPDNFFLFLNGWLFPSDASINVSLAQSKTIDVISPYLQVINSHGDWETVIPDMGFPMGKDKMVILDLSDKFLSDDHRVRIRTNMQIYWDHIFFSQIDEKNEIVPIHLSPESADLHFRGFSKLYRKGGPYGPHWFDYHDVSTAQKWRDLTGNYTRYGDVQPLITQVDDKLVIMNSGDEMTLSFDASALPDLPEGWVRDFLIYSEGWIKDGDLNTAHGKTVAPLPFHGMSSYPYGDGESYPSDKEHTEYIDRYNTRKVTTDEFRKELLDLE